MSIHHRLSAVAIAAMTLSGAGLVSGSGSSAWAADDATTLTIGMTVGIDNPNIWALNSTSEWSAVTLQYDMLMKFSDEDLSASPGLAESAKMSLRMVIILLEADLMKV